MADFFEFVVDEEQRMPTKEEAMALLRWAFSDDENEKVRDAHTVDAAEERADA